MICLCFYCVSGSCGGAGGGAGVPSSFLKLVNCIIPPTKAMRNPFGPEKI